jgi:hypothetical protein
LRLFHSGQVRQPQRELHFFISKISGSDKILENSETPKFSGLAIASLYADPKLMSKSGNVVIAAEAALEYGFRDFNGKQPRSLRALRAG